MPGNRNLVAGAAVRWRSLAGDAAPTESLSAMHRDSCRVAAMRRTARVKDVAIDAATEPGGSTNSRL